MSNEGQFISVQIFRFDPSIDAKPRYDTFQVPFDEEETILGVLKYVVKHHDPGLAFRESCRIGNCMACNVRVNGKGVVACRKALKDFGRDGLVLDPISEEKVIRDLVCIL